MKTIVSVAVVALLAAGPVAGTPVVPLDTPPAAVAVERAGASPDNFFRHVLCLVRKTHC
jgi:hypothetical protein